MLFNPSDAAKLYEISSIILDENEKHSKLLNQMKKITRKSAAIIHCIGRTLVDDKLVDHSDVVGLLPCGDAPTTSSFST